MNSSDFLSKLKKEGKISIISPSEHIYDSYLIKSNNWLKSAKILFPNKLYENVIVDSYYSIYNLLLALFFKIGIKSENHSASILIFDNLFNERDISALLLKAKKERVDKQYYVESDQDSSINEHSAKSAILLAEEANLKLKSLLNRLSNQDISSLRLKFKSFLDNL